LLFPHLPPPAPVTSPSQMTGVPASQVKRKHKFELVIEVPAKRFKARNHPTSNHTSSSSTASPSHVVPDTGSSAVVTTNGPVRSGQNRPSGGGLTCKVPGTTFKVNLDPKLRNISVTRDFMWAYFGANPSRSFSQIPEARFEKHGYDHFVFLRGVRTTKRLFFVSLCFIKIHPSM